MGTRMQQRRGSAADWAASDEILADGEIGVAHNPDGTTEIRVGDGVSLWPALTPYVGPRGLKGDKGDKGDAGNNSTVPGPQGPAGVGPTGTLVPWAGGSTLVPSGWLLCNGQSVSRTTYAALFAVIGTVYGNVDANTFNVPNLLGRTIVGVDTAQTEFANRNKSGGEKAHVLTGFELPSHNHTWTMNAADAPHTHGVPLEYVTNNTTGGASRAVTDIDDKTGGAGTNVTATTGAASGNANHTHDGTIGNTGGGQAHNNLQPYLCLHYIIKT
jgi:microcystin-dependent protein